MQRESRPKQDPPSLAPPTEKMTTSIDKPRSVPQTTGHQTEEAEIWIGIQSPSCPSL